MLIIREEQMQTLERYMEDQQLRQQASQLRAAWPAQTADLSETALVQFVRDAIRAAARYDIILAADFPAYFGFAVRYGIEFERHPRPAWARAIFTSLSLTGAEKLRRLAEGDDPGRTE
jgi:hypothetical protein